MSEGSNEGSGEWSGAKLLAVVGAGVLVVVFILKGEFGVLGPTRARVVGVTNFLWKDIYEVECLAKDFDCDRSAKSYCGSKGGRYMPYRPDVSELRMTTDMARLFFTCEGARNDLNKQP